MILIILKITFYIFDYSFYLSLPFIDSYLLRQKDNSWLKEYVKIHLSLLSVLFSSGATSSSYVSDRGYR